MMQSKGIDISTYQGYPDFKKVRGEGVEFVYIKAGQGRAESSASYLFRDSKFTYNIVNAHAAGLRCGVYYYFTARSEAEARKEAAHFISIIRPYKGRIDLHAAIDVESFHLDGIPKDKLTEFVCIFCDAVAAEGFEPMVYTNPDWLMRRLDRKALEKYPLWLALWRSKTNVPKSYKNMAVWQWGAEAVAGIKGKVDANLGYFGEAEQSGSFAPAQNLQENIHEVDFSVESNRGKIAVGAKVRVENPVNYDTGKKFKLYFDSYEVLQLKGDRAVIGRNGVVTAAVDVDFLEVV